MLLSYMISTKNGLVFFGYHSLGLTSVIGVNMVGLVCIMPGCFCKKNEFVRVGELYISIRLAPLNVFFKRNNFFVNIYSCFCIN